MGAERLDFDCGDRLGAFQLGVVLSACVELTLQALPVLR
ncbi:MAG: hypothetical protein ACI9IO_000467 [Cyanobium sp.]|jgi:hypothetical protein